MYGLKTFRYIFYRRRQKCALNHSFASAHSSSTDLNHTYTYQGRRIFVPVWRRLLYIRFSIKRYSINKIQQWSISKKIQSKNTEQSPTRVNLQYKKCTLSNGVTTDKRKAIRNRFHVVVDPFALFISPHSISLLVESGASSDNSINVIKARSSFLPYKAWEPSHKHLAPCSHICSGLFLASGYQPFINLVFSQFSVHLH